MASDSRSGRLRVLRSLRAQFLEAVQQHHRVNVEIVHYQNEAARQVHQDGLCRELTTRTTASFDESQTKQSICSWGFPGSHQRFAAHVIYGDDRGVRQLTNLSEAAGCSIPIELRPKTPGPLALFEVEGYYSGGEWLEGSEGSYGLPNNVGVWLAFVFHSLWTSGMCAAFQIEVLVDPLCKPVGGVVARLHLDPFQASLHAIDTLIEECDSRDPDSDSKRDSPEGLNASQSKAYTIIRDQGPIPGKLLAKQLKVQGDTLRRHILPALQKHGVRNDRNGQGYYLGKKPRVAQ